MDGIDPRAASHDPRTPAASRQSEFKRDESGMMFGMGRSAALTAVAVIALAVIVIAGLSFGWSGWLTASVGGISVLVLLPCLVMCGGMVWMMVRGK